MSQSQTSSVIRPLENVREKVKQRLMTVPEYRAFLAMEKPIAEVANISDLVAYLHTAQQKILERLAATKEYQALLTVEKAIQDLSQVLEVVADGGNLDVEPALSENILANGESPEITSLAVTVGPRATNEIAPVASIGKTPAVAADETSAVTATPLVIGSHDATELASSVEAAGGQGGKSISYPTAHLFDPWSRRGMAAYCHGSRILFRKRE